MLKLYVLIRDDLTEAQQAVQAGHAVAKFGYDYPVEFKAWQEDSNTLIYLSVRSIDTYEEMLKDGKFKHSVFCEPDLNPYGVVYLDPDYAGLKTAIAVAPNWYTQYTLFKDLPLAFQPKRESLPTYDERISALEWASRQRPLVQDKRRRWWQR